VDRALAGIAMTIKEGPNTGVGMQLRQFLWSLYNMHHVVNLWRLTANLDSQRSAWVAEVFAGALGGLVKDTDLKRTLQVAGEMERWEREHSGEEVAVALQEAQNIVAALTRKSSPSRTHTVLVSLLERMAEAQRELREEDSQVPKSS
jgi:replicative DNA helicase